MPSRPLHAGGRGNCCPMRGGGGRSPPFTAPALVWPLGKGVSMPKPVLQGGLSASCFSGTGRIDSVFFQASLSPAGKAITRVRLRHLLERINTLAGELCSCPRAERAACSTSPLRGPVLAWRTAGAARTSLSPRCDCREGPFCCVVLCCVLF